MSNPYTKQFTNRMLKNGTMDVYDILQAFDVTDQKLAHAIKKLLVPGGRIGGKSLTQDLKEAKWSIEETLEELNFTKH